jgi:hypothetical protein
VACETVPDRPDTYWAIKSHIDEIAQAAGMPEPLISEDPRPGGKQGMRKKGVIAYRRPRPELVTGADVDDAARWAATRVLRLHAAIEPFWATPRVRRAAGRGSGPSPLGADGGRRIRLGLAQPFREAARPGPQMRIVNGEATEAGWHDHEVTVGILDRLAIVAGHVPLYGGDPPVDISWMSPGGLVAVEVKSVTDHNELHQVRLGIGQIVDHAALLDSAGHTVIPVLAVSRDVDVTRWTRTCARAGVRLVTPRTFSDLVRG